MIPSLSLQIVIGACVLVCCPSRTVPSSVAATSYVGYWAVVSVTYENQNFKFYLTYLDSI